MRPLAVLIALGMLAACSPMRGVKVLDTDNGAQPGFRTTKCTAPNSDGVRCNVKTCRADTESHCGDFAKACMDSGHHYAGTNEGGTCTRVL